MASNGICAIVALMSVASGTIAEGKEYSNGDTESVKCYQNGLLIFETKERVQAFQPSGAMNLLADVSTGQVQETTHRLYASDRAGLVCVVRDAN